VPHKYLLIPVIRYFVVDFRKCSRIEWFDIDFYGLAVKTGSIALQKFFFVFLFFCKKSLLSGVKIFFPDSSFTKKRDTLAFFFLYFG